MIIHRKDTGPAQEPVQAMGIPQLLKSVRDTADYAVGCVEDVEFPHEGYADAELEIMGMIENLNKALTLIVAGQKAEK